MSGETLLTDLCAICHVNPIKYTCPRCGIHTCSLACVKKHKARAQCSGERNPAEYRKRADLATPSSIDKDFNFITSVERSIVRADEGVSDRGINLTPARQLKRTDARPKWEIEAAERGITVIKAPKGLTRGKQNKTHWVAQQKCIIWTLEWIYPDGERVLGQCLESRSIGDAFLQVVGKKAVRRKRRLSLEDRSQTEKVQKHAATSSSRKLDVDGNFDESGHLSDPSETPAVPDEILAGFHFYLHMPKTPSNVKCVIPVGKSQILRDVLDGQVLLEFPTVHVRYDTPEQLPKPFVTESEYKQHYGAQRLIDGTVPLEDGEIEEPDVVNLPSNVDSQKVLEVLAKDLAG